MYLQKAVFLLSLLLIIYNERDFDFVFYEMIFFVNIIYNQLN